MSGSLRIGWAAAAAGLLAGCAHYEPRPLSAERNAAELERRSLADSGLRAFLTTNHVTGEWPRRAWDLNALTLAAFYFSPDLDVARAQLAGARAGETTAGQRPNPTVGVAPSYDTTTTIPSPWVVTATLDVPLETAGKRGHRRTQAAHLTDAARFRLAAAAWRVRSQVRRNFLALYAARERATRRRQQETLLAGSLHLLEAQRDAGAVSPIEVTRARIALNRARFARQDAEQQLVMARAQLAAVVGVTPAALAGVKWDFSAFRNFPVDPPAAAARHQALLNRADLLAALAEYAAAESALQLEIARQYPDVHLGPGYEFDQGDNKWGLGLSLELPVLNQNQGPIAEAEARRAEAAARFNALQARVLAEIEQAVAGYRVAARKAEAARALDRELTQQLRAARNQFAAGGISRLELVQRRLELADAALARLDAVISAQESLGALEDALQSPATLLPVSESSPRLSASPQP
jgi:outer membrane protein TolC